MPDRLPLLFEIGAEELPAKSLQQLEHDLRCGLMTELQKAGLNPGTAVSFATPRRLAVFIEQIDSMQVDRHVERRGPATQVAFTAAGLPTAAAEGFARSCGVPVSALEKLETEKGEWLAYRELRPGESALTLLPALVNTTVEALPMPRRMRWGDGDAEFARPVRWIVLLLGSRVVPARVLGLTADRLTYGHRFHHPQSIELGSPGDYPSRLTATGYVIPSMEARRAAIHTQVREAARAYGGEARLEEALVDEVTALVEWPVAIVGEFDPRFLRVPHEALITTMQENQRYFPVFSKNGRLLPAFVTVANLASRDPDQVRQGNERVIRPRFADAEFFWLQDLKTPLADRLARLEGVTFEQRLGSLRDKTDRLVALARSLAESVGANPLDASRAARLCKCDLVTTMVFEFPELQGIMGSHYARHDGEAESVVRAIEEHYLPRHAGDRLPATPTGRVIALADRLDTILGIFCAGKAPSGNRDPFGLRRAALGIVRTVLESGVDMDLVEALDIAAEGFPAELRAVEQVEPVFRFIVERMRGFLLESGSRPDEFEAVEALRPTRMLDFHRRMQALAEFRKLEAAVSLAAANKRIRNILRQSEEVLPANCNPGSMTEPAEIALAARVDELAELTAPLVAAGDYLSALSRLAGLREPVDHFFDQVMVMAEDPDIRRSRLALLARMEGLFLTVADLSRLQD
jgi:glycyl-tRNA synthetase beta chain